ncbi:olfactory receptor 14A16-like [Varanus komodoensis]|uniref:olfactory receptor 14A16-like n=1 Tax=Varanus komodoensis TaxID=61221 RepID=UPI001CF7947D|nr:olfactory receptor 14A16-like [Varanus komodoensis]
MFLKEQNMNNESSVSDFLLLEFSDIWDWQIMCFIGFLVFYLAAVVGNLLIISAVASDHHLHTPMYFFLMNLAMQDVGQVSVIIPKAMTNTLMNCRHISYSGCVAQVLFFVSFTVSDFSLLTVMAYDRYVAICSPLLYQNVMNKQACIQTITIVWIFSFFYGVLHTGGTFASPFCSNVVNQFFCEIPALLKLACSDLYLFEIGLVFFGCFVGIGCSIFIVVTYVHIFSAVLRMPSAQGRQKAFSTCVPHLMVLFLFLFSGFFAYLKPTSNSNSPLNLAFAMIYFMVPPLMNPVIYSMRNRDIKDALSKMLGLQSSSSCVFSILFMQKCKHKHNQS